ncbi:MAG: ATP-binding protein [Chlamydiae bacterium]|nr:ATP-binding protein [Chlamydiota bacterium]
MKKFFSIAGAVRPEDHYFIPHRLDESRLLDFIEKKHYFILHAPRQSGKTTAVLEWVRALNQQGKYKAFYINVEAAQAARGRVEEGMRTLLHCFRSDIMLCFGLEDPAVAYLTQEIDKGAFSGNALYDFLQFWSQKTFDAEHKHIVLFIDEIDSLVGDTLISVLRQLRAGYVHRPGAFPQSVCLFGVRDVRDYRIWSDKEQATILGGSAFNIKAESLTLEDFSFAQVKDLYLQHTEATGQIFTEEAVQYAFEQTAGQPWLVNALAYQACFRDMKDRSQPITLEVLERARESLIKRCDTHLDVLIDRLQEARVRNIIDRLLSGEEGGGFPPDDLLYVRDLGLISRQSIRVANPIYQEIIPRALAQTRQEEILQDLTWYQKTDGLLDMNKLLEGFTTFYREHSDIWLERFAYKEAGPHILLLAFLQRIINGGGRIHREYALGRKRVDLRIDWKTQCFVLELKIYRKKTDLVKGLEQTVEYMDSSKATEGHLILFDRDRKKSWNKKIYHRIETVQGKTIHVWGL